MKRLLLIAIPVLLSFAVSAYAQRTETARKYVKQGIERFSKNDIEGAIAQYDRAISIDPKLAEAYLNRGKARRAGGDLDGAISDYEVVAELDSRVVNNNRDITQAYLNRGYIRSNRMDLDGALTDFDKAIQFDPFLREIDALLKGQIAYTYLSTHTNKGFHRLEIKPLDNDVEIRHPAGYTR